MESNQFLQMRCEALERELQNKTEELEAKNRLLASYERPREIKEKPHTKYPACFEPLPESELSY